MVKGQKKREPFWKKLDPEIQHVTDHLGKIIDNSNVSQIAEAALNLGLAYAGYKTVRDPIGFLYGPLALKLAQSGNIVAGTAGMVALISLGIPFTGLSLGAPPGYNEEEIKKEGGRENIEPTRLDFDANLRKCPDGFFLTRDSFGELICLKKLG